MRDHILNEIRRLGTLNGGQPPGMKAFARDTGMESHLWRGKYWARWSDALSEAGYSPNEWQERLDIAALLPDVLGSSPAPSVGNAKAVEGFVYLFKSGEFYKIGRSDDLERRIRQIGIKLPEKLTPIHSIRTDDPPGIEAYWHRRFADKRANGEWFKLSSMDITAFKKRKYQ